MQRSPNINSTRGYPQTYAQGCKPSTVTSTTQTDENITQAATISEPPHLIPVSDTLLSTTSSMFIPIRPSSSIISETPTSTPVFNPLLHLQRFGSKSKFRDRKRRKKKCLKSIIDIKMAQLHRPSKPAQWNILLIRRGYDCIRRGRRCNRIEP
ncbi:hypothetical protein TNCV_4267801 [Trichonephila clavipes]|nr:hypothetical protein TNCV_4267801 [Trichonephila clavipes]